MYILITKYTQSINKSYLTEKTSKTKFQKHQSKKLHFVKWKNLKKYHKIIIKYQKKIFPKIPDFFSKS